MENYKEYFNTNRELWNKRTAVHLSSDFYDLLSFKKGKTSLNDIEMHEVGDVQGKTLLHLQCHFGMDTLSWARLGAHVTGVDISDAAINEARMLAQETRLPASFVCCNVYDTRLYIKDVFEVVFTSYGTIGWLPDLERWAYNVAKSLDAGGFFYMVDFHPVLWMFDENFTRFAYPYYNKETIVTESKGTYADREADIQQKEYGWNHSISEILNALINNGLEIQIFNEHYYSPYNCFANMVETAPGQWKIKGYEDIIPMLYSLKATKK